MKSLSRVTPRKQFFFPSHIDDWATQLTSAAQFIDFLTWEDRIASEVYWYSPEPLRIERAGVPNGVPSRPDHGHADPPFSRPCVPGVHYRLKSIHRPTERENASAKVAGMPTSKRQSWAGRTSKQSHPDEPRFTSRADSYTRLTEWETNPLLRRDRTR